MWLAPTALALATTSVVVHAAPVAPLDHPVHAELGTEAGWTHAYTSGDVVVYKKGLTSVNQTAWMGKTTLPEEISPEDFFTLLSDTDSHDQYNRSLAESVVLDRTDGITTFYQVVKTPPYVPLSDRWWIAQAKSTRDADDTPGHLRRMWATLPSSARPAVRAQLEADYPGAIEIAFSGGRWDLIPRADGSTQLVYRIVTDPGGAVPRALSSRFAGRSVAENLESMLKAAGKR